MHFANCLCPVTTTPLKTWKCFSPKVPSRSSHSILFPVTPPRQLPRVTRFASSRISRKRNACGCLRLPFPYRDALRYTPVAACVNAVSSFTPLSWRRCCVCCTGGTFTGTVPLGPSPPSRGARLRRRAESCRSARPPSPPGPGPTLVSSFRGRRGLAPGRLWPNAPEPPPRFHRRRLGPPAPAERPAAAPASQAGRPRSPGGRGPPRDTPWTRHLARGGARRASAFPSVRISLRADGTSLRADGTTSRGAGSWERRSAERAASAAAEGTSRRGAGAGRLLAASSSVQQLRQCWPTSF